MDDRETRQHPAPGDPPDGVPQDPSPVELPISPEPPPLVPWTVSITPPAAPINGWVAGQQPSALARPADRPPSTASRVLRAIAWIVGIAAMLFFGRIYAVFLGGTELTAEQTGEVVGYLLGSLLIGFAVRWLFVRAGRGKGLLSPWVPVVATFILLLNLGRASGQAPSSAAVVPTGGPAPTARATPAGSPRDIEAFLVIAEPYDMERATAEEVTDFGEAMGAFSDQTQVRRITRDGIVEGFFVVVDSGDKFPVNSLGAFEFGLKTQEGIDTERATLGGHEVVVATVPDDEVAFVSWLEVPRILVVYGVDEASARNMATAVINAYK